MSTKTIEERIRKAARDELMGELNKVAQPLRNKLQLGHALPTKYGSAHTVLEEIVNALFEQLKEKREERAIEEFLSKVNSLQSQVDELREQFAD